MSNKVENFDDIIFENRNKDYGAYELRKKYSKRGVVALAVSIVILLTAVGAPLIASIINEKPSDIVIGGRVLIDMDSTIQNPDELIIPPPPPPPVSTAKDLVYKIPKPVDSLSSDAEDFLTNNEILEGLKTEIADTTDEKIVIIDEPGEVIVETQVFQSFEIQEQPSFEGGEAGLMRYITDNIQYPQEAIENGIKGIVYIRFVVKSSGEVGEVQLLRSVDDLLDKEALRVVKSLPKWNPGKQNGNAVNVWFTIPINFKLSE
jgi:protein TonB